MEDLKAQIIDDIYTKIPNKDDKPIKIDENSNKIPSKDDIVIPSSYGKSTRRGRSAVVEVASPEPQSGVAAAGAAATAVGLHNGLVRVQLEESGEILEVEAKYLEEVSHTKPYFHQLVVTQYFL